MKTCARKMSLLAFAASVMSVAVPAHGVDINSATALTVGPVNPANGFPAWYRDSASLPLDLCMSQAQSPSAPGVAGAIMCILPATGEEPGFNPALPVVFPTNFPSEPFFFIAESSLGGPAGLGTTTDGSSLLYRAVVEAAFASANGGPAAGQQITFSRVRFRADTVTAGDYRIIHPYGVKEFPGTAAGLGAINFTEDLGVGTPGGPFADLVPPNVNVGPYLQCAAVSGGVANPPIQVGSELFIGDPNVPCNVTGSPAATNLLQLERDNVADGVFNPAQGVTVLGTTPLFTVAGKKIGINVSPFPSASATALVGTPALIPFTITNITSGNVAFTSPGAFAFTGANAADFTVVPATNTCTGVTLVPAPAVAPAVSTCTFEVQFNPAASAVAARTATLTISADNAATAPPAVVALQGTAQYQLTVTTGANGTFTNQNGTAAVSEPVNAGTSKTYRATPATGYAPLVKSNTVRQTLAADGSVTLAAIAEHKTISATFLRNGDLDQSGTITVADALRALRIFVGVTPAQTDEENVAADVGPLVGNAPRANGRVDISDVVVILRRALNLEPLW